MDNPEISIIIPVYNVSQFLRKCLDSLLNQTFKNFEIICFNDASPDNSLEILRYYEACDSRIKVIDSKINIKQGGGRNHGIRASRGKYIMFVDPDDWVDPYYVEKLYSAITAADADIATADYFEWNNGVTKEIIQLGKNINDEVIDIKKKVLLDGCSVVTSIYRKSLFFKNNLFFPEGVFYEDNAIIPAIFLSASKIVKIDENLYYYRHNNNSTTNSINDYRFFDRLQTSIMAIENIKRLPNYNELSIELSQEINWLFTKLYLINTLMGLMTKFSPIPIDRIRPIFKDINKYLPEWRSQVYYKKNIPLINRIFFSFLEKYPQFTCSLYTLYRNILKK